MNKKKKTPRDIIYYDKVYNNPRSDRQDPGMDDAEKEKIKNKMLFDAKRTRTITFRKWLEQIENSLDTV